VLEILILKPTRPNTNVPAGSADFKLELMLFGINVVLGRIYCVGYARCGWTLLDRPRAMVSDRAHLVDFHQRIIFLVKSLVKLQIGMKIAVVSC
jgi:hypothetical protein